jgi:peroxiredoxin Q/BCP
MLEPNTIAPDFSGAMDDGTTFRLSEHRGQRNVVLYFYPRDFSGGCTMQACSIQESYGRIRAYNAIIVGISADSVESHRDFRAKHDLEFNSVSDPSGEIRKKYEAFRFAGIFRPRITYVIDKAGVIRSSFQHDIAIGRHVPDIIEALEQIRDSEQAEAQGTDPRR